MNSQTSVITGKALSVKFSGMTVFGVVGTWKHTFKFENAEKMIEEILSENPTNKVVKIELVDWYELV